MKRLAFIALALLLTGCAGAGQPTTSTSVAPVTSTTVASTTSTTVDPVASQAEAILKAMTLREKASQVFLVRFRGKSMEGDGNAGLLIDDGPYGGFVFIQGNIGGGDTIRSLTTRMQEATEATGSPLKLFITTDQEGGISRITAAVPGVPYASALGKTSTPERAGELAAQTARGLASLGLNMNLAPVADVAPLDSYIGKRSFGDDPARVSAFITAVVQGYEQNDVMAVVKHFPGHGSAEGNTHSSKVIATASKEVFEQVHLAPFKAAIAAGADGIMLSHITALAYDPDHPASRAPALIKLLREDLHFDGLIVTDSLCMDAAAVGIAGDSEGAAVASLQAGVDLMVIMPTAGKVMAIRNAVIQAVEDGRLSEERLDEAVLHIIEMKLKRGLVFAPQ